MITVSPPSVRDAEELRDALDSARLEISQLKDEITALKAENATQEKIVYVQTRILFNQPPPELLHLIFLYNLPPTYLLDSSLSRVPHSPWSEIVRFKKAIVRVCKAWRAVATPLLYEDVTLHRVGQVAAFLQALEGASSYGGFVRKISVSGYVPRKYGRSFGDQLQAVLCLCPRLVHFVVSPTIELPNTIALPMVRTSVTQVELNHNIDYSSLLPVLVQICGSLSSLSLHPCIAETLQMPLHFEQLKSLCCGIRHSSLNEALHVIREAWSMPSLERLTFGYEVSRARGTGAGTPPAIQAFCVSHGKGLKYLHLAPYISPKNRLQEIVDACPRLEHLVISGHNNLPVVHPNIKWIDVWELGEPRDCLDPWYRQVYSALKKRKVNLPAFQCARILKEGLPSPLEISILFPPHEVMAFDIKYSGLHIRFKDYQLYNSTPTGEDAGFLNGGRFFEWNGLMNPADQGSDSGSSSSEESDWDIVTNENSDEESDGDLEIYAPSTEEVG